MKRLILIYGLLGGALIVLLRVIEYRFLVLEHSIEIYGGIIALLFASLGIWLGLKLTKKPETKIVIQTVPAEAKPFQVDESRIAELRITKRELEILGLIASGLSNREISEKLFVSENTVKTHSGRLFEKLDVKRRTQAVQRGKEFRLLP